MDHFFQSFKFQIILDFKVCLMKNFNFNNNFLWTLKLILNFYNHFMKVATIQDY